MERAMLHHLRRGGPPVAVAAAAIVLAACGSGAAMQVAAPAGSSAAAVGSPQPYQLYTHCGIDEARIGNRYFEAVHPLSDGQGNPPPGWGNPYQQGTMTLLSPAQAVFRDSAGHQVQFRLRPGATAFKHLCT
jgi:hypothetical protein